MGGADIFSFCSPVITRGVGLTSSMGPQTAPRVREPGTQYLWECIYRMAAIDANSAFQLHLTADTRHPLFHRPLVEFMLSLDPSLRAWGRNDRILQRRALADRLPEAVRTRMTKGSDQQLREREQMKNETWQRMLTKTPVLCPAAGLTLGCGAPRSNERGLASSTAWDASTQLL